MSKRVLGAWPWLYYACGLVTLVGACTGAHIYRWEVVTWLAVSLCTVGAAHYTIKCMATENYMVWGMVRGQAEMLKQWVWIASNRNRVN